MPPPSLAAMRSMSGALNGLLAQVEGAVYRVQVNQLQAVSSHEAGPPSWHLEVPVRHGEQGHVLELRIERERAARQGSRDDTWSVDLALNLEEMGPVHARITVTGAIVSTGLWASRPATAALFERNMDELRGRLAGAGLNVGSIHCHRGTAPRARDAAAPSTLLHLRA